MKNSIRNFLNQLLNKLLIIALIITLLGFAVDVKNTVQYGGADLRNRVVGARLWVRGMDPYHFQWDSKQSEQLLDPLVPPGATTTRVSVPPNVLLIHAPFTAVPYLYQRVGWLFFQWGCFVASLLIFLRSEFEPLRQKLLLLVGLLLFSGHNFWRLHIERGQIYILYVFLLAMAYGALWNVKIEEKGLRNIVLGGSLIGLASALRFPIIIMVLPMIFYRRFKLLAATVLSFITFLASSIALTGPTTWKQYSSALAIFGTINKKSSSTAEPVDFLLPKTIEGMTNLGQLAPFESWNSSLQRVVQVFSGLLLKPGILILLLCVVLLGYVLLIYAIRQRHAKASSLSAIDNVFLFGTLMVLIADFFVPAPRYMYNQVQILLPLLLIFKGFTALNMRSVTVGALLTLSLLIGGGAFSWLSHESLIGEYLTVAVMVGASLMLAAGAFSNQDILQTEESEL